MQHRSVCKLWAVELTEGALTSSMPVVGEVLDPASVCSSASTSLLDPMLLSVDSCILGSVEPLELAVAVSVAMLGAVMLAVVVVGHFVGEKNI